MVYSWEEALPELQPASSWSRCKNVMESNMSEIETNRVKLGTHRLVTALSFSFPPPSTLSWELNKGSQGCYFRNVDSMGILDSAKWNPLNLILHPNLKNIMLPNHKEGYNFSSLSQTWGSRSFSNLEILLWWLQNLSSKMSELRFIRTVCLVDVST